MAKTAEEKKAAQAAAHKKWRESEKGRQYAAKRKVAKYIADNQADGQKPQS